MYNVAFCIFLIRFWIGLSRHVVKIPSSVCVGISLAAHRKPHGPIGKISIQCAQISTIDLSESESLVTKFFVQLRVLVLVLTTHYWLY